MSLTIAEPCEDCGKPWKRRRRSDRRYLCMECGVAAAINYNTRLHNDAVQRKLERQEKRHAVGARADH